MLSRRNVTVIVVVVATLARVIVVGLGGEHFPPAADGTYYAHLAARIAGGHGYTWDWPDGAVTPVAHYPVGYPAMLAVAFKIFGQSTFSVMLVSSFFGVAMSAAGTRLLLARVGPRRALLGGLALALHPALVAYTPAAMTEGLVGAVLVVAALIGASSMRATLACGLLFGVGTLIRPQLVLLAPLFGFFLAKGERGLGAWRRYSGRIRAAALVGGIAVATCLPWTIRNCVTMNQCALVSVNGGWNLLIGTQTKSGAWEEMRVPEECRTVWDEAKKDECFRAAGIRSIEESPRAWFAKVPRKLAATFDYYGAAPWYLRASNGAYFTERMKLGLGALETIFARLVVLVAALALVLRPGNERRPGVRSFVRASAGVAAVASCLPAGWVAHLALAVAFLFDVRSVVRVAGASLVATAVTHAVFFGGGRYALVVVPLLTVAAAVVVLQFWTRSSKGPLQVLRSSVLSTGSR